MTWKTFKDKVEKELHGNILPYWMNHMIDDEKRLYGEISNDNIADRDAPIGLVMTSRFLWTYSEAYRLTGREEYRDFASAARDNLLHLLYDRENGGFFWLANREGKPLDRKKVLYGQAFALYGLSTWQIIAPSPENEILCLETFALIEKHGRDMEAGGYLEACAENWEYEGASNLGADDLACDKSMNTNLHMLEGYMRYYLQSGRDDVREALLSLIHIIIEKIYSPETGHQRLYFSRDWTPSGDVESYGHDVETSWLLWEALEILGDKTLLKKYRETVLRLFRVSSEKAEAPDGSLWNEKHDGHRDKTRIWWIQAEYAVSLMNAWEMTGETPLKEKLFTLWNYIETTQRDNRNGEWYWGILESGEILQREKGGMWKTPYHNGRACLELIRRIDKIKGETDV